MADDDVMGRNPLDEELDSVWKVPAKKTSVAESSPLPLQNGQDGSWEPLPESDGEDDEQLSEEVINEASVDYEDALESEKQDEDHVQLVGFMLESELFGIDIIKVQEIIRVQEITRVPKTDSFVRGVVNLRGKVIPVISLKVRFSFDDSMEKTKNARIVIVNTDAGMMGFEVDEVTEVLRIPKSVITPPPTYSARFDSEYITGVGKLEGKILVILNLDKLLAVKEAASTA
ncbi:MAG: hypothetical protein IEMM0002_0772 [bacterium]|nr:MAG: hypothetical protein IEMM0002_0772 [bacterium]